MPANPAAGSSGQGRRVGGTRVIWRKLDCLNPNVRREALRCIPGAAGRNSEGGSWDA